MTCIDCKEAIDEDDGAVFWNGVVFCSQCGLDVK
jgi:hypothetical protein